jgi:hypothetical protein
MSSTWGRPQGWLAGRLVLGAAITLFEDSCWSASEDDMYGIGEGVPLKTARFDVGQGIRMVCTEPTAAP